jgi:regulatory protein
VGTPGKSATACAMGYLARRDHSRAELRWKLERRGFAADEAEAAVCELQAAGWLSEQRVVEGVLRRRLDQGHGPLRLRADLLARGIAPAVFEPALDALDVDWDALAREQVRKRFGIAPAPDRRELARRGRFLHALGYPQAVIWRSIGGQGQAQDIGSEWDGA